ncbi:MAG TPA: RHS repeat-associated core domain-containing protein [Pyrinomonadaceae bacterium]
MFATISNVRLLAQADDVPNDPTTAMTIESGDPITDTDDPNNQDVPADANYTQPEEPYAPDLPETVSNYEGPVGVTGIFNGNITTGCSYDPLGHSAHRAIDDIVVPGSIGKYPLKMTRYYNSRQQYYALAAIGLSPGWAHEYSWLLWAAGHKVVSPHGNVYDDYCGAPVGVSERWENRADAYNGTWRLADGGKVVFTSGRVTDIYDPYGQRTRIAYDATGQRVKVTEPGGRCLWFTYSAQDQDGTKLLTWVQAYDVDGSPGSPTPPTGHIIDSVNYTYTACDPGVEGRPWKKMLTGVNYSDGRSASYQYRTDNVHEDQTSHKMYPVLQWCDDVRYNAPMRTIRYDYQNAGPHGAIIDEKYPGIGAVSAISPGVPTGGQGTQDTFTETRGDGPDRTFNYTHIYHCQGAECGPCDDQGTNGPNQQMLLNYTDFRGQTTYLGYDANWYINSVRDTNNHTSSYTRGAPPPNGIGEITQITYPGGAHVNYGYESPPQYPQYEPHYITSITNERGKRTTYTRDGNHRVTRIDYPFDQYTPASYETFTYNNFGQVLTHRLKNGAYESFAYSTRGLLTDKWNPKQSGVPSGSDPHTHYDYYTSGWWTDRVKIETLPANTSGATARETYEYDRNAGGATCAGRGLVTKITHADGKYRKFGYTQFGTKAWEENELSQRTNYTYDNYKRLRTAQDPMSHTTSYDYSPAKGNTTQCYLHTTNSPYWVTTPALIVTKNLYDQNFRKTSATVAWNTPSAATTSFGYDNVGNLTRVTDPRNKVTVNGYDARNRKTSTTEASGTAVQETTVWHYDPASNINQIDRPDGTSEIKGFDALNRMMWDKVPYWWTTPPEYHITWFTYNPSGTVQSIRDPKGQTTSFAYNASDEKITMTYPINQTQSWVYDNAHNLASRTTVGGKTQNFMYDNLNRKVGMTWSNGADSATYGYDYASRLTSATNPNSTVTRTYYADGRLEHDYQAVTGLGSTKSANYVYNGDGNVTWMNVTPFDSPSYNWSFTYDAMGRFETIAPYGGSVAFKYAYDNASNVTHRYTYLPGSVTVDQSTPRDSLNRIYGRWIYKNGAPFAAQGYTYDQMNRLTTVTWGSVKDMFGYYWDSELYWAQYVVPVDGPSQVQEGGDPDLDTTGGIDPWANYQPPGTEEPEPAPPPPDAGTDTADTLSQLQSLETPGAQRIVGYGYDKAGNRWATTDNGTATSYYANSLNQYTGVGDTNNVVNGSEHEIQTYQGNTYTYINDEHLKQVTSGTNTYNLYYDALGRCVKRTLGSVTTYYVYDGERPVLEYKSGDLTHPAKNLYGKGIDEILMRTDPTVNSGQPFYYGQDHEGSVTHLINTSGNVIENYQYDAYGAVTKMWTNGTLTDHTGYNNRFLFTGREYGAVYQKTYVPAFTFYEYRARAYHPGLGRFMSEDPKLFDAGDYNLFRYCHNDPLDMTDPMGLDAVPNGDGTYHFVLRSDVVVPNMIGAYVINKSNGTARQCAGAGQFLTGTRLADGTLHDAPPARHSGWTQGAPVTKDTPNGTLVARRWENGVYPNKDIKEYNAEAVKKDPSIINHTGIKVGWENGKAIILDQWRGESGSLQKRSYDPKEGDWSVVNAKKPYDPQPSTSDFNLDQAIKKGIQEAQDAASDVIHTKPHEQRQ